MSDDANKDGDNGEAKQQSEHLNLKVKAQDGNEVRPPLRLGYAVVRDEWMRLWLGGAG